MLPLPASRPPSTREDAHPPLPPLLPSEASPPPLSQRPHPTPASQYSVLSHELEASGHWGMCTINTLIISEAGFEQLCRALPSHYATTRTGATSLKARDRAGVRATAPGPQRSPRRTPIPYGAVLTTLVAGDFSLCRGVCFRPFRL